MKNHLDKLSLLPVILAAGQLTSFWYAGGSGLDYAHQIADSLVDRPYVYRALIPFTSRTLGSITGIDPGFIFLALVFLSVIGLHYSIRYLLESFGTFERPNTLAAIGTLAVFSVCLVFLKPYDFATALFFSLCLGTMARGKLWAYYLLFPIATLNRETTFLLSIFYAVYFFRGLISRRHWIAGSIYQGLIYVGIKYWLSVIFAGRPGVSFFFSWTRTLSAYAATPVLTAALLVGTGILLFFVFRRWEEKPAFLRLAFAIVFPLQVILHFILGYPFEVRVFAEIVPVLALLAAYPLPRPSPALYPVLGHLQEKTQ